MSLWPALVRSNGGTTVQFRRLGSLNRERKFEKALETMVYVVRKISLRLRVDLGRTPLPNM